MTKICGFARIAVIAVLSCGAAASAVAADQTFEVGGFKYQVRDPGLMKNNTLTIYNGDKVIVDKLDSGDEITTNRLLVHLMAIAQAA